MEVLKCKMVALYKMASRLLSKTDIPCLKGVILTVFVTLLRRKAEKSRPEGGMQTLTSAMPVQCSAS